MCLADETWSKETSLMGLSLVQNGGEQLIFTVCLLGARHSVNGHLRRLNGITSKQPFEGGDGTLISVDEEAEFA